MTTQKARPMNVERETAENAYLRQYLLATVALDKIRDFLRDLPNPEDNDITWGHAGDLSEVTTRLLTIVELIGRKA